MNNFPNNWESTTLQDVLDYVIGGDWGKELDFDDPDYTQVLCIRGAEFRNWEKEKGKTSSLRKIKKTSLQNRCLLDGDILLEISGGGPEQPVGRSVLIDNAALSFKKSIFKVCTNFIRLIRPNKNINSKFLNNYLQYFYNSSSISDFQSGSNNLRNLKFDDYIKITIPLPPLEEQKRIVAKIEELFSEIDKGIENLLKAQELLKAYQQSLIKNAATGELLISLGLLKNHFDDSCKINLSKVISEHGQGWSPKCLNEPSTNENDWAVIKTTAIQNFEFLEDENKLLPKNLKPKPHLEIATGDILVTRAGPRNRVGIACLVRECRKRLILCDKAYRIKVNYDMILPEYLEMLLNSPHIIDKIEYLKTGINDSGVNLTQERFLALELLVPPLSLQKLTLQKLQDNISITTQLNQQISIASEKLKNIRQSILKKAFSGEIVFQNATDESASILLERIKAEKEIPTPQKKKSKQLQKVAV
jgi:type I restriction enzyme S subunit